MTSIEVEAPTCVGCGVERVGPGIDGAPGGRTPCPVCAEMGVHLARHVSDSAGLHEMLAHKLRGLRDGKRKTLQEGKNGDDWCCKDGRWHHVYRAIDHVNNWYDEIITDAETGELVHECHEPLTHHRGHGSAARSRPRRAAGA